MRIAHPRAVVRLLTIAFALTGLCVVAGPASAEGDGHITGTVTGPDHRPAPVVTVTGYAWQSASGHWEAVASTFTIGDGSYDLGGLPTGSYRVGFSGNNLYDGNDAFQTEYWNDAASLEAAQDIAVWSGTDHIGFDAELMEAGGPRIANTSLPVISGTARAGSTLTATTGTWAPSTGLSFDYQWFVGGGVVGTGPSYTPTEHVGETVRVAVTAITDGYRPRTVESEPTAALAMGPSPDFQTLPTMSGTARVGVEITATPGTWTPAFGHANQEWLVDDVVVASGPSYRPVVADAGKSLQARTSAWTPWLGHTFATSSSVKVAPGTLTNTWRPKIAGTPKARHKLFALSGGWSPRLFSFTYQWLRDGRAIRGARHHGYKLPRTAKGHRFSVRVTARHAGYDSLTVTSKRGVRIS